MGLSDRFGQVDKEFGLSFEADNTLKLHRFPRIARINEQVGTYALATLQGTANSSSLLRIGRPIYEPGESPLPKPATRRFIGGCVNIVFVSASTLYSREIISDIVHTALDLHRSVFPQ